MVNLINQKWKTDPKKHKNRIISSYDIKLIAHIAVRCDNWVFFQKSNPSNYVKTDGTIDPCREKKIFKNQ